MLTACAGDVPQPIQEGRQRPVVARVTRKSRRRFEEVGCRHEVSSLKRNCREPLQYTALPPPISNFASQRQAFLEAAPRCRIVPVHNRQPSSNPERVRCRGSVFVPSRDLQTLIAPDLRNREIAL